jgi:hypothetical protein
MVHYSTNDAILTMSTGWYITSHTILSQQCQQDGTLQHKSCYLNNVNTMVHYSTNDAISTMSTGWYITAQSHVISTMSTGWYITAHTMISQQC